MQAQDPQIKSLHQRASSHYLRGEFRQALEVWKGVIELDPEDERALEGVRLCELLVEEGATAPQEPAPSAPTVEAMAGSPFASAAEGFDRDLDELDEILETGLGSGPAKQAAPPEPSEAEQAAPPEPPEAEQAEDPAVFFDFSNVPEIAESPPDSLQVFASETPGADIEFGDLAAGDALPLGEMPADEVVIERHSHAEETAEAETPAAEGAQEAAAAELRSRVNELLAEALTAYEQDHKEEALAILNRIFILDENNHAALALHDNIRVELEAERAAADETAEAPPAGENEEAVAPLAEAGPLDDEPLDTDEIQVVAPEVRPAPPPRARQRVEPEPDELEDTASALAQASEKRRLLSDALLTRQNLMLVATLVVVVIVGGFLAFTFMRGSRGSSTPQTEAASLVESGLPPPAVAVVLSEGEGEPQAAAQPEQPAEPPPAAAEPAPAQEDAAALARRLEDLLAQAGQAMQRSDWAAAVLAFNQALEIDPANPTARDGLAEAGEQYREVKAQEQKYREAIDAFRDGNYRAALTLFYRLPEGEDAERLNRYKRNGWYNMGIQALAVGDCGSASTNLKEARAIDPQDRGVLLALDLANNCPYSRDTESFRTEARQLPLRRLDD